VKKTNKILEVLGLVNWRNHRPVQLSGGQQRVAIGRALITSPPIDLHIGLLINKRIV
jgi:ABC-type methionine transport system ATPase subunit